MSKIERDTVMMGETPLVPGEVVKQVFLADKGIYWRNQAIMAVIGGIGAALVLFFMGNAHVWVGPVAAVLALGARAYYLRSEALGDRWRMTDRRLLGPGGRIVPLGQIEEVKPFLTDVMLVTRSGDKHLMKYFADPALVIAAIENAIKGAR